MKISYNEMDPETVKLLTMSIIQNSKLISLDVSGCMIYEEEAYSLIKSCIKLKELIIS